MLSERLESSKYDFSPDINPKWTRIQRVPGQWSNTSQGKLSFSLDSPIPGALLSSRAYIKWGLRTNRTEEDAKGEPESQDFPNFDQMSLLLKTGSLLANSCTNATVSINGYPFNYKDSHIWSKHMGHMHYTRDQLETLYSTSGGPYPLNIGAYDNQMNLGTLGTTFSDIPLTDLGFVAGGGNSQVRVLSDTDIVTSSGVRGFDIAVGVENTVEYTVLTNILEFAAGGGSPVNVVNLPSGFGGSLKEGDIMTFTNIGATTFEVVSVLSITEVLVRAVSGDVGPFDLSATDTYLRNQETARIQFGEGGSGIPINLAITQRFQLNDIIFLTGIGSFRVIGFSGRDELIVGNIDMVGTSARVVDALDTVTRQDEVSRQDDPIDKAVDSAFRNYRRNTFAAATADEKQRADFEFLDFLWIGPFNPFYDTQDELPKNSWYKRMSNQIPYVSQLSVDLTLKDLSANSLLFPFSIRTGDDGAFEVLLSTEDIINPELVVEWIVPKFPESIPKSVEIPSWDIKTYSFPVNDGNVLADANPTGPTVSVDTDFIYIHQVPSFLLLFATRDKDSTDYVCVPQFTSNSTAEGGDPVFSNTRNSWEPNMIMSNTRIELNVNNTKVNTTWDTRDLYTTTARNCKQIPFDFTSYLGGPGQYNHKPCNFFTLLRPDDLSIKIPPGQIRTQFAIRVTTDLTTATGYWKQGQDDVIGSYRYKFHVVPIFSEDFITLSKDKVEKRRKVQFV